MARALAHTGSAGGVGSSGSPADHAVAWASPPRAQGRRIASWVGPGPSPGLLEDQASPSASSICPYVHTAGRKGRSSMGRTREPPEGQWVLLGMGSCNIRASPSPPQSS